MAGPHFGEKSLQNYKKEKKNENDNVAGHDQGRVLVKASSWEAKSHKQGRTGRTDRQCGFTVL